MQGGKAGRVGPQDEQEWQCKTCSYANNGLMDTCEMCDNQRGSDPPSVTPKMTPLIMLPLDGKEREKGADEGNKGGDKSPLLSQLQSSKEVMEAGKMSKQFEEEKVRALLDFGEAAANGDL